MVGSFKKHGVAVAEEAIVVRYGMSIGGANSIAAGEGRDEHQQGRLRQVKVGDQPVDDAEPVSRRDEDGRFCRAGA